MPKEFSTEDYAEPIFVTKAKAAQLLSVCTRTLDTLEKNGVVKPLRHNRLIRYRVSDILALQGSPTK